MSTSSRGSARERKLMRQLEGEGWVCVRSPASSSPVDVWAMIDPTHATTHFATSWEGRPLAIQVKANVGSPWMNFRKKERGELVDLAAKAGAEPLLVHWPPHGDCRWYGSDEWPRSAMLTGDA